MPGSLVIARRIQIGLHSVYGLFKPLVAQLRGSNHQLRTIQCYVLYGTQFCFHHVSSYMQITADHIRGRTSLAGASEISPQTMGWNFMYTYLPFSVAGVYVACLPTKLHALQGLGRLSINVSYYWSHYLCTTITVERTSWSTTSIAWTKYLVGSLDWHRPPELCILWSRVPPDPIPMILYPYLTRYHYLTCLSLPLQARYQMHAYNCHCSFDLTLLYIFWEHKR